MGFAVLGFSVPVFVVGYLLIYFFAIQLAAGCRCRATGRSPRASGPSLRASILPSFALGMAYMALIARITRATMLEVLPRTTSAPPTPRAWRPIACCCSTR